MILTYGHVPNIVLWRQWARGHPISFIVNAKFQGPREEGSRVVPLSKRHAALLGTLTEAERVVDTALGSHTLCVAHHAMLRAGLKRHPDATWFALVSGNSLPMTSAKTLLGELCALGRSYSLIGEFECASRMWGWLQHHRVLRGDALAGNWWVEHLDNGDLTPTNVRAHGQFSILCAAHAQLLADMPKKILRDFDELADINAANNFKSAMNADEVVQLTYLRFQGCGDHILDMDVMLAPVVKGHGRDFKGRVPATLIKHADEVDGKPVFFLRKITEPLDKRERKRLRQVWSSRPPIFVPDKVPTGLRMTTRKPVMTRARKRQRMDAAGAHQSML